LGGNRENEDAMSEEIDALNPTGYYFFLSEKIHDLHILALRNYADYILKERFFLSPFQKVHCGLAHRFSS
jgi:hypothetical protein